VHRDVKPANVLLGERGTIKLADLGIATAADSTRITRTGGALGTVAYMAPEQFEPEPVTAAADVYALAAVAFEALAGRPAYPGSAAFAVFERLRAGTPPPDVREHRPELAEGATAALRRGMAAAPEDRPESAGAFVDELERALGARTAPQAPDPTRPMPAMEPRQPAEAARTARWRRSSEPVPSRRRRRSALVPVALLALVGLAGAIVALSVSGGDEEEPRRAERTATGPAATVSPAEETPPAIRGPQTPVDAVRRFYMALADGEFAVAWRLAGPNFRGLYGNSRASFDDDYLSLRGIRFEKLDEVQAGEKRATVALQTVAEHTDRTERCRGTIQTLLVERRWRVEPTGVSCDTLG
jgi:serine/threonine-protein kinase